jgi:hypothetical protein
MNLLHQGYVSVLELRTDFNLAIVIDVENVLVLLGASL